MGGRPILERFGRYILVSPGDLERADRWFARYGDLTVFFSRLLPVVRTFISFPAGVARMNLLRFTIYTFLGSYPWSLGLAYGGYILGENWERLRAVMRPFDIPILVALLVLLALYIWRHIRDVRRQARKARGGTPTSP
jgi:membrane protein DedA with SNARE-associated domain